MQIMKQITPDFYVAHQISAGQIPDIAAAGIRAIMCNRPDGEEYDQPGFADVERAAAEAGLETAWVPLGAAGMTPEILSDFAAALDRLPRPVLAYCRTGTRCTTLWTITMFDSLSAGELLRMTSDAGYDMSGLIAHLQQSRT